MIDHTCTSIGDTCRIFSINAFSKLQEFILNSDSFNQRKAMSEKLKYICDIFILNKIGWYEDLISMKKTKNVYIIIHNKYILTSTPDVLL